MPDPTSSPSASRPAAASAGPSPAPAHAPVPPTSVPLSSVPVVDLAPGGLIPEPIDVQRRLDVCLHEVSMLRALLRLSLKAKAGREKLAAGQPVGDDDAVE